MISSCCSRKTDVSLIVRKWLNSEIIFSLFWATQRATFSQKFHFVIKMANFSYSFFPKIQFVVIILICIQFNEAKLNLNSNLFPFNFEQIKFDLFSTNDFAKSNKFGSENLTEHHQCLKELNAIKHGMNNFEPWAIQCKQECSISTSIFQPFVRDQSVVIEIEYFCVCLQCLMHGQKCRRVF